MMTTSNGHGAERMEPAKVDSKLDLSAGHPKEKWWERAKKMFKRATTDNDKPKRKSAFKRTEKFRPIGPDEPEAQQQQTVGAEPSEHSESPSPLSCSADGSPTSSAYSNASEDQSATAETNVTDAEILSPPGTTEIKLEVDWEADVPDQNENHFIEASYQGETIRFTPASYQIVWTSSDPVQSGRPTWIQSRLVQLLSDRLKESPADRQLRQDLVAANLCSFAPKQICPTRKC